MRMRTWAELNRFLCIWLQDTDTLEDVQCPVTGSYHLSRQKACQLTSEKYQGVLERESSRETPKLHNV